MGLRLIRQESETPNVSNHDDGGMARYAYGGYDGYVKNRGQEIGSTVSGTSFVVLSGVISLQGWEVEVDANGVSIPTSASVTNKTYFSVYLEVNCATDTAEIKSLTDTAGFPDIPASDDLTENTIGTARLLLYHFTATGGVIADVEKLVQEIPYGVDAVEDLGEEVEGIINGTIKPEDAKKVNGLEIKSDEAGVLRIGDSIIPQKKLLWEGEQDCSDSNPKLFLFNKKIPADSLLEVVTKTRIAGVSRNKYSFYIYRANSNDGENSEKYHPDNIYAQVRIDKQTEITTIGGIQNHYDEEFVDGITIYGNISKLVMNGSVIKGTITITKIYRVIE